LTSTILRGESFKLLPLYPDNKRIGGWVDPRVGLDDGLAFTSEFEMVSVHLEVFLPLENVPVEETYKPLVQSHGLEFSGEIQTGQLR
jgi:hypothetical protein